MKNSFFIKKEVEGIFFTITDFLLPVIEQTAGGWGQIVDYFYNKQSQGYFPTRDIFFYNGIPLTLIAGIEEKRFCYILSPHLRIETISLQRKDDIHYSSQAYDELKEIFNKLETINNARATKSLIRGVLKRNNFSDLINGERFLKVQEITKKDFSQIVLLVKKIRPSLVEWVTDLGLTFLTRFPFLRDALLGHFVVLPNLKKNCDKKEHLIKVLNGVLENQKLSFFPRVIIHLIILKVKLIPASLLSFVIQKSLEFSATRFVAGTSIAKANKTITLLKRTGRDSTLDQLGELVVTNQMADRYVEQVLNILKDQSKNFKLGELNAINLPKVEVSIKVTALSPYFSILSNSSQFDILYNEVAPRLKRILREAKKLMAFINVDAEHYHYRGPVFRILKKAIMESDDLRNYPHVGVVLQAYLKDADFHFYEILSFARERGLTLPIRLVKGAYLDSELRESELKGIDSYQFMNKEESDLNFRLMMNLILKNSPAVRLRVASHNFADHAYAEALRKEIYHDALAIEHQCLHMTCDPLSIALTKMGMTQRDYVPLGEMVEGMGYLTRRILENSSQVGFLNMLREQKDLKNFKSPEKIILEKEKKRELIGERSDQNFYPSLIHYPHLLNLNVIHSFNGDLTPFDFERNIKIDSINFNFEMINFLKRVIVLKTELAESLYKDQEISREEAHSFISQIIDSLFLDQLTDIDNKDDSNLGGFEIDLGHQDLTTPLIMNQCLLFLKMGKKICFKKSNRYKLPLALSLFLGLLSESFRSSTILVDERRLFNPFIWPSREKSKIFIFDKYNSPNDVIEILIKKLTYLSGIDLLSKNYSIYLDEEIKDDVLVGLNLYFEALPPSLKETYPLKFKNSQKLDSNKNQKLIEIEIVG